MIAPKSNVRLAVVACVVAILVAVGAGLTPAQAAGAEPATKPSFVKVEVKLSVNSLKPGDPCTATVTVTNTSDSLVMIRGSKDGPAVRTLCWQNGGRVIPKDAKSMDDSGRLDLKPGESTSVTLDLAAMYGLRSPGRYLVAAGVQFSTPELSQTGEADRVWVPSPQAQAAFIVAAP